MNSEEHTRIRSLVESLLEPRRLWNRVVPERDREWWLRMSHEGHRITDADRALLVKRGFIPATRINTEGEGK